jgi:hypothetical protein
MESRAHVRERIEALEQRTEQLQHYTPTLEAHTRPVERQRLWWRSPWSVAVVAALGLALASPAGVQATIFHCRAGDVPCLIDAIMTANANGTTNTIRLKAGTYALTAIDNGTPGDVNGLPVITSRLTITGEGAETTIIERALGAPSFRFLQVQATGHLRLTGLTLRGGGPTEGNVDQGGALFNSGSLTLRHCTLTENGAVFGAAGIYNRGTLTLHASVLRDNVATLIGGPGGGLINAGGVVRITHTTFDGNFADGAAGLDNRGTMTIAHTTFVNNLAPSPGGGLGNTGTLTITDSTFVNNHGTGGGGLVNRGTLTITNTTFNANTASDGAGGVTNGGILTLINSTIADNRVFRPDTGSGLDNFGSGIVWVVNTILAGNTRQPPGASTSSRVPADCQGPVTSLGHNLIGEPTGCTITLQPSDLTGDPGLGPFTDNGRPGNGHFPLLPTSQAIDAGDDAACPRRDQLGQRRVNIRGVGTSRCDIGAIEFPGKDDHQHDEEDDQDEVDPAAVAQASP